MVLIRLLSALYPTKDELVKIKVLVKALPGESLYRLRQFPVSLNSRWCTHL